ncbi:MAG: hypothetical protein LBG57_05010 [Treponema sp.]|nr:hypothetical protein [Treponema sp.]
MKTYEDYLNDPALAGEPRALREVHAMRLKVQDEIRGMTATEQTAYFHEAVAGIRYRGGYEPGDFIRGEYPLLFRSFRSLSILRNGSWSSSSRITAYRTATRIPSRT